MSGIDSAQALRCAGSGYHQGHRAYPPQVCPGKHGPCGRTFTPTTPNGKYCEQCRKSKPSRFQWET